MNWGCPQARPRYSTWRGSMSVFQLPPHCLCCTHTHTYTHAHTHAHTQEVYTLAQQLIASGTKREDSQKLATTKIQSGWALVGGYISLGRCTTSLPQPEMMSSCARCPSITHLPRSQPLAPFCVCPLAGHEGPLHDPLLRANLHSQMTLTPCVLGLCD